jgi:hypothetical protein
MEGFAHEGEYYVGTMKKMRGMKPMASKAAG